MENPLLDRDWLSLLAERRPNDPAAVDDRPGEQVRVVTFKELDQLVNRLANGFLRSGLGVGGRVAFCSRNSIDILVVVNAARRIGSLLFGVNHQLQRVEARTLVRETGAQVVWTESEFAPLFTDLQGTSSVTHVVVADGPALPGLTTADALTAGCPDDLLVDPHGQVLDPVQPTFRGGPVISGPTTFTGGTTGKPKGIIYNWDRLKTVPKSLPGRIEEEIYGPDPHVFITSGSFSHGGPSSHAYAALAKGGTIIVQRRFDPEDWLRLVTKYRVSASYCPPIVIRRICALPASVKARYDVSSIRVIVAGAAKWPYRLKLEYRELFPPDTLWELYGSSELGSNIVMRPDEHWARPESSGRPAPGYELVLRSEHGTIIDTPNLPGVLYVKGPYIVFDGYEGDPVATGEARWGDYWTVGDVAYFDEDGYYYICDRIKDMFISGGVNVYPAEIEVVLESHPDVMESAVFGIPDDTWGERPYALIVPRKGVAVDLGALQAYCRKRLAAFKVPVHIDVIEELPHTHAGKVSKQELRQRYWDSVVPVEGL